MENDSLGLSIIYVLLFFSPLIAIVIHNEGTIGRKRLLNASQAKGDANIVKLEPKSYGSKSSSHMELIVNFSDGTSYRDKCNAEEPQLFGKRYWLDQEQIPIIVAKAIEAHEIAVQKNEKRKRSV